MSHSVLTCLALRCTLNFYRLVLSVIMARIDYKREVIAGVTDESSMARSLLLRSGVFGCLLATPNILARSTALK